MQKTMQSSEVLEHYEEIKNLAVEIKNSIYKGSFEDFGELLKEEWEHKKQLSEGITNPQIDAFFEKCEKNGALGYKLLGAGGGGYALLFTDEEHRHELIKSLAGYELRNVEFVKNGLEVWGLDESKRIH
jgi:D-glycero-alpha-D-manno-heptose-7-phosphate kinase